MKEIGGTMKHLILAAIILALAPAAFAQLYKYTDKDGKTVYTDQPPANADTKPIKVQTAPAVSSSPTDAPKTAVAKDKENDKGRKEAAEKAKKAEETALREKDNEERCANATSNYKQYEAGGRFTKRTESGERVFLDEAEQAAEKEKARAVMERVCKKA
jgi:hypothetical protein